MRTIILIMMITLKLHAQEGSLFALLQRADSDKHAADELYERTRVFDYSSSPLDQGLKAMGLFMKCRHAWNFVTKLSCFNEGKILLEHAVKADPGNVRLRYFRFSVQRNAPSFLGYYREAQEDRRFLQEYVLKTHLRNDDLAGVVGELLSQYK